MTNYYRLKNFINWGSGDDPQEILLYFKFRNGTIGYDCKFTECLGQIVRSFESTIWEDTIYIDYDRYYLHINEDPDLDLNTICLSDIKINFAFMIIYRYPSEKPIFTQEQKDKTIETFCKYSGCEYLFKNKDLEEIFNQLWNYFRI